MYLAIKKQKGIAYLHMLESVYDRETGKVTKKFIKSFGRYDKVSAEVKKQFEDQEARKKLEHNLEGNLRTSLLNNALSSKESVSDQCAESGSSSDVNVFANASFQFCYGHLALKPIWETELGLKYKISYLQKAYTDIEKWSLNDLLFYLASTKIINPQSYLKCSQSRTDYFYCPWGNVHQDNFYRALDFVYEHKDEIIQHAAKTHMNRRGAGVKIAFFDCTNTWVESPYDDLVWRAIRYGREYRKAMRKERLSDSDIDKLMESKEYKQSLQEELDSGIEDDLRMRGMSKEGRYSQPIVSIALAVDEYGFPIDCAVFAGNVSEIHQVEPMLHSLKSKYGLEHFYFVADRGLNTTEILKKAQKLDLGFVVAQKVSQQTKDVRTEMFDLDGYRNYSIAEDGSFIASYKPLNPDAARFKVCDHTKTCYVQDKNDPSKKRTRITVKCKIVYTFSPERKARDLATLEELKRKAQKAVDDHLLLSNSYSGWRGLVETEGDRQKNGQSSDDKEQFRAVGTKEHIIQNRENIAGYAAIVFDHPKNDDIEHLSDVEVLDTYHKLVEIEESFRVMKSSLNLRPLFVRLKERITAHCYICVLSLMMTRILQDKIAETGLRMSAARISEALSSAKVMPLTVNKNEIYFRNLRGPSNFYAQSVTGKSKKQESTDDVLDQSKIFKSYSQDKDLLQGDTQLLFKAAGFSQVPINVGMNALKRILKITKAPNEVVISLEHQDYIRLSLAQ